MHTVAGLLQEEVHLPLFPRVVCPGPFEEGAWLTLQDSSQLGLGAFLAEGPGCFFCDQWLDWERECFHINVTEALATSISLDVFGEGVPGVHMVSVIHEAVDNTTAEHSAHANRSKSRELHMSRTLSRRALSLARLGITSTTMRVSTKQNLFADLLSRGAVEEFLWAARQCGFEPIRLAIPGAARSTHFLIA